MITLYESNLKKQIFEHLYQFTYKSPLKEGKQIVLKDINWQEREMGEATIIINFGSWKAGRWMKTNKWGKEIWGPTEVALQNLQRLRYCHQNNFWNWKGRGGKVKSRTLEKVLFWRDPLFPIPHSWVTIPSQSHQKFGGLFSGEDKKDL